jgi:hypothetical protein
MARAVLDRRREREIEAGRGGEVRDSAPAMGGVDGGLADGGRQGSGTALEVGKKDDIS